jgi:phage tail protein X
MRALIGLLLLGGLFLIAASWQRGQTRSLREQRQQEHGLPEPHQVTRGDLGADWSLLVLGSASGAEPIPGSEPRPTPFEGDTGPVQPPAGGPEPPPSTRQTDPAPYAPDYRYEVQGGDFLGKICDRHYGTSRPGLVDAVARYNGLTSPDAVRTGDTLVLPDRALLEE